MSEAETLLAILQTACESDTPAALMSATMAVSCSGRLSSVGADGVVLEFLRPPPGSIGPGDACAVSFPHGGRTVGFTSRTLGTDRDAGGRFWITLQLPTRLQHSEQRLAVRVPVPDGTLRATVHVGERAVPARALDLSLHGILLHIEDAPIAELQIGHRRMVELQLTPHEIVLEAEVRRVDGGRHFGLLFIRREERPRALAKIMAELQRRWSDA